MPRMTEAEKVANVTQTLANIETMYQAVRRQALAISVLYARGSASCVTVRDYNLLALAVYGTQKAILASLTASGAEGLPSLPTSPTLFTWNGVIGENAVVVQCAPPAGVAGVFGATGPSGIIPPGSLAITTSDPDWQNPYPTLASLAPGQLGNPLAMIILVGVGILAGSYMLVKLFDMLTSRSIDARATAETAAKAVQSTAIVEGLAGCVLACQTKSDPADCIDACHRAYPIPSLSPTFPSTTGSWGTFALAGLVGATIVGTLGFLKYRQHRAGRSYASELPAGDEG